MAKASNPRKQLNVRSETAYHLAHMIGKEEKISTRLVVERALTDYAQRKANEREAMTPQQMAMREHLMTIGRETKRRWKFGEASEHDYLYDEDGLPI